ncbi:hypothetical protein PS862_04575 [Pseudomonas fluorescens]|uniref:Bestrophin n=1 Tax=Pseudomonas fluorescens TaxID=294 RepID=A0A5E6VTH1_PSEFL|nr:bestrophin family protein [Pseudomonas fluorescens]VVN20838.1 hypothetical protein PS639_04282 [Pseudomonas fluorescens]VVP35056.1 hypothetical protein PS862_04575 [Pseudomonas fluorescens]
MIVRPKPNLINILSALKGSIAKRIAVRSLMVTLLACVIVLVETLHPSYFAKVNATPFTLLGLSLSIFMSFRNNACYDRWYEARKAWGEMLVAIRSMIRETQVINSVDHSNHEGEFFILPRAGQDVADSTIAEQLFMNLNFAFACMIVVSFAIALGHG